jgi:hypothetical protein
MLVKGQITEDGQWLKIEKESAKQRIARQLSADDKDISPRAAAAKAKLQAQLAEERAEMVRFAQLLLAQSYTGSVLSFCIGMLHCRFFPL